MTDSLLRLTSAKEAGALALMTAVIAVMILSLPGSPIVDESVHYAQAQMFARGEWHIHEALSTWPTINLAVAAAIRLSGLESLTVARATVALFALLGVVAYYKLAAHFDSPSAICKTAQFFLLPIVLPLCGLVYTDIPALAAIFWMFYGAVKKSALVFCAAGLLAVAFRQTNILWLLAGCAFYAYLLRSNRSTWRSILPLLAFAVITSAVWVLVIRATGGVALTPVTQGTHVLQARGLPNVEFALGLGGILFLPIMASLGPRMRLLFLHRRSAVIGVVVLLTIAIALTFNVSHPYNTEPTLMRYLVRNRLLHEISDDTLRWFFALVVALSALGFALFPFWPRTKNLRIPFFAVVAASLLPFWLIEQRYYLPFYALFNLLRQPLNPRFERAQLLYNVTLAGAALWLIIGNDMFL